MPNPQDAQRVRDVGERRTCADRATGCRSGHADHSMVPSSRRSPNHLAIERHAPPSLAEYTRRGGRAGHKIILRPTRRDPSGAFCILTPAPTINAVAPRDAPADVGPVAVVPATIVAPCLPVAPTCYRWTPTGVAVDFCGPGIAVAASLCRSAYAYSE